jgi:Ca-activated chloride channel family protein
MTAAYLENWWFLIPIFVVGLLLSLWTWARDKRDLKLLGLQNLVLSPELAWGRRIVKSSLVLAGLFLVLMGALRLQGKPVPEDLALRGSDVMVVLDVSKSMLTRDMVPNRLEAAKKAVATWMQSQEGDRVGLVAFSGEAAVQVPLTLDLQAVSMVLENDDTDTVERGGTDIGKGIRQALLSFPKENPDKRGRAILLLTDGELTDRASNLKEACQEAKDKGVPIVAVGLGTPQGKAIPDGAFWGQETFKKDIAGNVHISKLDESTLRQIADSTDGLFVNGDNGDDLDAIDKVLDKLQKSEMKGKGGTRREEWAPAMGWLAATTLFLSAVL